MRRNSNENGSRNMPGKGRAGSGFTSTRVMLTALAPSERSNVWFAAEANRWIG